MTLKHIPLLLLLALSASGYPQASIHPLVRLAVEEAGSASSWVDGYAATLAGEPFDYDSPIPDARQALLVRATDGTSTAAWQTGAPANLETALREGPIQNGTGRTSIGQRPIFIFLAALGASMAEQRFSLFADEQKLFTFTNSKNPVWESTAANGAVLRFSTLHADRFGDHFGLMSLEWPEPLNHALQLRVTGEAGGSSAWFILYTMKDLVASLSRTAAEGFWYRWSASRSGGVDLHFPQHWSGREMKIISANGDALALRLKGEADKVAGSSTAHLTARQRERLKFPLRLTLDGRFLDRLEEGQLRAPSFDLCQDGFYIQRSADTSGGTLESSGSFLVGLADKLNAPWLQTFSGAPINLISSSHQDIAWMDSPEQCMLDRDSLVLTPAIDLLESDPGFRYVAEQSLMLEEYLTLHPDHLDQIRRLTREGRLEWGATYNQPYEGLYTGEQLIRGLYFGRKWLDNILPGSDSRVAWNVDVPGRTLQMPQILAKSGVPWLIISRHQPGLFWWRSPDGSRVGTFSPGHYHVNTDFMRRSAHELINGLPDYLASWEPFYAKHGLRSPLPLLVSTDMGAPIDFRGAMREWNGITLKDRSLAAGSNLALPPLRAASAAETMEKIFGSQAVLPEISGERPNVWLYIHGPTHHWAISESRRAGKLLPAAETFATIAAVLRQDFGGYPAGRLDEAWKASIYPDHGWGGKNGHITDSTFLAKYRFAAGEAELLLQGAQEEIAARIALPTAPTRAADARDPKTVDAQKALAAGSPDKKSAHSPKTHSAGGLAEAPAGAAGTPQPDMPPALVKAAAKNRLRPLVVFNDLSFARRAPVTAALDFAPGEARSLQILDADGRIIPGQLLEADRRSDGTLERATVQFVAAAPAIGYQTFFIQPDKKRAADSAPATAAAGAAAVSHENSFYRIELAPGGIRQIHDKELDRDLLRTDKFLGGELFTMRSVGNGAGEFAAVQQPDMEGFDRMAGHRPRWEKTADGAVSTTFTLEQSWLHCRVEQSVTLYKQIKRIDFSVALLDWDGSEYREFRLAFPLAQEQAEITYAVPFGTVTIGRDEIPGAAGERYVQPASAVRPREVLDWIGASDRAVGVTISSSVAVWDYADPTPDPAACPLLQPVLLASRRSCHGEGNWYLQAGDHHFAFSLTSHAPGWQQGLHAGIGANTPLRLVQPAAASGGQAHPAPAAEASPSGLDGAAPGPAAEGCRPAAVLPLQQSFCSIAADNVLISTIKKADEGDGIIMRCCEMTGTDTRTRLSWFTPLLEVQPIGMLETGIFTQRPAERVPFNDPQEGTAHVVPGGIPLEIGHHAVETFQWITPHPDRNGRSTQQEIP